MASVHNLKIVQFLLHAQYNNGQHSLWIIFSPLSHVMVLLVWQHCLCMTQNKTSHNLKIKQRDLRDLVPTELYTHLHVSTRMSIVFQGDLNPLVQRTFTIKPAANQIALSALATEICSSQPLSQKRLCAEMSEFGYRNCS